MRVRRAISAQDLRAAYRLVHDVFVAKGYISPQPGGMRLRAWERSPDMATFVAEDEGKIVGVLSVVPLTLWSKVSEMTNFAILPEHRRAPAFTELTKAAFAHAWAGAQATIAANVSLHHVRYFRDVLGFRGYSPPSDPAANRDAEVRLWLPLSFGMSHWSDDTRRRYIEGNRYIQQVFTWDALAREEFARPGFRLEERA